MKFNCHKHRIIKFSLMSRLTVLALTLGFICAARATDPLYQNSSVLNYVVPGNPPPTIDASNFVNQNQFNINFESFSIGQNFQYYEPMNTVNYTNKSSGVNTGIMTVGSPFVTNGLFIFDYNQFGAGFQFDTQTTNTIPHREAGTFYNGGTIRCDSVLDGNNIISFQGFQFFDLIDLGQCLVWATNIICPGNIDASEDGFIQLTGQNVDLRRAVVTLEQGLVTSNNVDVTINSEGAGYDTNGDWDPFFALTPTNAYSSLPDSLYLSFSTPYFDVVPEGPSNILVRAVFILNANTNTPANVYIAPAAFNNEGALIQWSGTFFNSATGLTDTNYLYLFHFFPNGTNIPPILSVGAIPNIGDEGIYDNFLWQQGTPFPGLPAPTSPGFPGSVTFNNNVFTNIYEYFNSTLTGTTVGTNANSFNPSGALTNLPARIQITADNDLKLDLAQISGDNYLSLTATNQFDGSPGAQIDAPYSDINLGVTNGYPHPLTISNLLVANMPQWAGTLNEWGTHWTNTDINGINWDFRVMLVYANLTPALSPQVQNLTLTASNVVISDVLNVFGSIFANAQSLTLTTNYYGGGAESPDGELNLQLQNPLTWSWGGAFPDLLYLTNSGAIRLPNYSEFIGSGSITNIVPGVPAIAASATLAETGPSNNIAAGGTVAIGGTAYQFVNTLTNKVAFQVKIGKSFDGSLSNLIAAINRGPGAGTSYSTNTFASSVAVAGSLDVTNSSVVINANPNNYPGTLGNGIPVSTTVTNLAWNGFISSILSGGVDSMPGSSNIMSVNVPYGAIVNSGYMADQGSTVWVTNFVNSGVITNGPGSFDLTSFTTTLTNGFIAAGGDISLAANTIIASNVMLQAGRSLVLEATNVISDESVSNGNVWVIGSSNGTGGYGLVLPFLPVGTENLPTTNNLLGTTISMQAPPPNKQVESDWAGVDLGDNTNGYTTNDMAIGQLILTAQAANSTFYFSGPPGSTNNNAIYVDRLVLENYAGLAYPNWQGVGGPPTLVFNTNDFGGKLTIYYADALSSENVNGGPLQDVSYILNGLNGGRLVWVPQYVGYFSHSTNQLNIGLVENSQPAVVASRINFKLAALNVPQKSLKMTWESFPGATNTVYYSTNLTAAHWVILTNFVSPTNLPPVGVWPINDVVQEPYNSTVPNAYYRVTVMPNSSGP